ncbi:hypothetical protein FRC11_010620, partial [Ceratobasidium sp. 423]
IENKRFKVHKSKLIKSETFADMFTVAESSNTGDQIMEGTSVEYPIKLEGVSASDFECLLTLLYESHYTQQHPELTIPLALSALRLAHMWNFAELRACLLSYLEQNLDDVGKIAYAREFDIKEWVAPAYVRLCRRTEPLNTEEAERIDMNGVLLVFRLREDKRPTPCQSCLKTRGGVLATRKYHCSLGKHSWDVDGSGLADDILEEKIKTWEEKGQVFS